jgi:photosystem II oxygen-evolving enhancer protein 2
VFRAFVPSSDPVSIAPSARPPLLPVFRSVATQSAALVQQRVKVSAKASAKAPRAVVAPVRAAAAKDASSRRSAILGGVAAATAALAPAKPALALSGFSVVKDTRDGYQFYYPVGWQEITVDGQDAVYKDIIEPLESVALNIYPTTRENLAEIGTPDEVAKTLVSKALAVPGSQAKVLKTAQRKDKEGHLYYALEYVTKTNSYERHALTIVTITQGKFYTLTTGSSERRWLKMKDRLQTTIDSFNVYY